jgi:hypothetical protein
VARLVVRRQLHEEAQHLKGTPMDEPKKDQPPPCAEVLAALDELMLAEVRGRTRRYHHRVTRLCKIAQVLEGLYANRVDTVPLPPHLRGHMMPRMLGQADDDLDEAVPGGGNDYLQIGGGMGYAGPGDTADLVRQATSVIQEQEAGKREDRQNPVAQLERLSRIRADLADSNHDTAPLDARIRVVMAKIAAEETAAVTVSGSVAEAIGQAIDRKVLDLDAAGNLATGSSVLTPDGPSAALEADLAGVE